MCWKPPTGAKMMTRSDTIRHVKMSTKYIVASRRIVSKRLGIPGYLGFLAVLKMTKNARMSTVAHDVGCGVE